MARRKKGKPANRPRLIDPRSVDPVGVRESWYRNRNRVAGNPARDRLILLRAHMRLQCTNRGHAYDPAGQCLRCGEISPEAQARFDQIRAAAETAMRNGAGEGKADDHAEQQ